MTAGPICRKMSQPPETRMEIRTWTCNEKTSARMRNSLRIFAVALSFAIATVALSQTQPAPRPTAAPDLTTPKATLLSLYHLLGAGDIASARGCLSFASDDQVQSFDIAYTQLYAPLALVHALQARFGPDAGKPFGLAPLEKSLAGLIAKAQSADIQITNDTAAVVDHSGVDPSAENELTGITFERRNGPQPVWKVTAATFMTAAGQTPPAQKKFMLALRDATASAVRETSARLTHGDFKTPEEAFADYKFRLDQATKAAVATTTQAH